MSFVAAAIGVGAAATVATGVMGANASKDAANTQANAANEAAQLQYKQFEEQQKAQEPWRQAGIAVLPQLQQMASTPVSFSMQDFFNNKDPAYQFNMDQGMQALQRSAAARGGLMSGGTLKDIAKYSQGLASNEYQNAYNRFMNNQNTQFNRLSSIAGYGQTANNNLANSGTTMANNVGNIMTGNANAQAASTMAQSNAWGNTLSGLANMPNTYMQYQQMGKINNWLDKLGS